MPNRLEALQWTNTEESTNVKQTFFDEKTQTICVKFHGGGLYSYIGGSMEIYMGLVHAPSVGKYLNNVVKALPYTRWETEQDLLHHLNT